MHLACTYLLFSFTSTSLRSDSPFIKSYLPKYIEYCNVPTIIHITKLIVFWSKIATSSAADNTGMLNSPCVVWPPSLPRGAARDSAQPVWVASYKADRVLTRVYQLRNNFTPLLNVIVVQEIRKMR